MKAIYRKARISPKKISLIADLVRGKNASKSLDFLKFTPKKGARILYHVLKSALSNAENNFNQDGKNFVISKIIVTKGPVYNRHIPISRGRVHPIQKKTSHITVEVQELEQEKKTIDSHKTLEVKDVQKK